MTARVRCFLILAAGVLVTGALHGAVAWHEVLDQKPEWYASGEAREIAEAVLLYQDAASGGWPKNRDMTKPPAATVGGHDDADAPTIDNGATWTQLRFLGRVHAAYPDPRYEAPFVRGFDYLLAAQYANGGWPQFFPLRPGYYTHITFNDDAMIRVLELLRDIAAKPGEFRFLDAARRERAGDAVRRGVDCILKCQVEIENKKTAWCAQHDETTFAPAPARKFEPASLSGFESVGIVRFLMSVERPTPEIIGAVDAAVSWFETAKLTGVRIVRKPDPRMRLGFDPEVVLDPSAPPLWARFYEFGSNVPIFTGRDGVIRYALREIEAERRGGYMWYTDSPAKLLDHDYPRWRKKHGAP